MDLSNAREGGGNGASQLVRNSYSNVGLRRRDSLGLVVLICDTSGRPTARSLLGGLPKSPPSRLRPQVEEVTPAFSPFVQAGSKQLAQSPDPSPGLRCLMFPAPSYPLPPAHPASLVS